MSQLNNRITGEIIKIDKISNLGIYYSIFENSFLLSQNKFGVSKNIDLFDKNIQVDKSSFEGTTISHNDIEQYLTFQKIIEVETNFEISEDYRNWFIETGSTDEETLLRLFIPRIAYNNALKSKDTPADYYYPLWQIIEYGTTNIEVKYSQITDNSIVIYLLTLLPEHKTILDTYRTDGVLVEDRYPEEDII